MADGIAAFHAHLDECWRCRERPMDLCQKGALLLKQAATLPSSETPE